MDVSGDEAVRKATSSKPVELLARLGLIGYGILNLLVAFLAVRIALGQSSETVSKSGALQLIAEQPGGAALLSLVAAGLAALAVWQVGEAVLRPGIGSATRRALRRAGHLGEAAVFALFAVWAARLVMGAGSPKGGASSLTARVLAQPFGQMLVIAAGAAIVAGAAYLVFYGVKRRFLELLDLSGTDPKPQTALIRLGQIGYVAVGVAYVIVGLFVITAAVNFDPHKAEGLDVALRTLADQPFGTGLLLVVAAGLACYGVFCVVEARYRRGH